jgi:hypothetical protein
MFLLAFLGIFPLSASIDARQLLLLVDNAEANATTRSSCVTSTQQLDDYIRKDKYVIGIHAEHDQETSVYNNELIFQEYLTATAGQTFDPPITFEVVPVNFEQITIGYFESQELDFFYANPGIYSCVGTEVGAIALNTVSITLLIHHAIG